MKQNIGKQDKLVRAVVGSVLVILGLSSEGIRWLGFVGLIPLVTAALGYCPAYCILGKSTTGCCGGAEGCKTEASPPEKKEGGCCGGGKCSE